jgi:hypothetical protein
LDSSEILSALGQFLMLDFIIPPSASVFYPQAATPAASQLAASVIQTCEEKLEPFVCGFLTSCFLDRDAVESELKEFYHEILFKVFQCAPHMLLGVIPNLTQELLVRHPPQTHLS